MTDWKTLNEHKLSLLHVLFAGRVRLWLDYLATQHNLPVLITQGLRTWAEQDALYAQGRTTPGTIVTNARGGHSHHNFGLAVDVCPDDLSKDGLQLDWNINHPAWQTLLATAPSFGLAEGAQWRSFPDNPHFYPSEIPATCAQLAQLYEGGGMDAVGAWFESLQHPTLDPEDSV